MGERISAALDHFERQLDPDGTSDPAGRARRAEHARKTRFPRLILKSVQARRAKATDRRRQQGGGEPIAP